MVHNLIAKKPLQVCVYFHMSWSGFIAFR